MCCHTTEVCSFAVEHEKIYDLAMASLRAVGTAAEWISLSSGAGARSCACFGLFHMLPKAFYGEKATRVDVDSLVASGCADACIEMMKIFEIRGVDKVEDTNAFALGGAIGSLIRSGLRWRGCEEKMRTMATTLEFCLQHSLDMGREFGNLTDGFAAQLCACVFGRDEEGSPFTFTQPQVDSMLTAWQQIMKAEGYRSSNKPSSENIQVLELCVSDRNKSLLLANTTFIPYLMDGLLLDPNHPRAGKEALLQDPRVKEVLHEVVTKGWIHETRDCARAALLALSDRTLPQQQTLPQQDSTNQGKNDGRWIMMSYCWEQQGVMKRINAELQKRGYCTWIDIEQMRGSTVDASESCPTIISTLAQCVFEPRVFLVLACSERRR
eukprot:SAG31_NODE_8732_length_1398_cov_0.995381_1_plen_381_part_01